MPNADIGFAEGPALPPPDATQVLCVLGVASGLAAGDIKTISDRSLILAAAGYGPAPELAWLIHAAGKRTVYMVGCASSTAATCSAITQTGQGPTVTVSGTAYDDASVTWKVSAGGAHGVAQVQVAFSYVIVDGVPTLLYQPAVTVPARQQATIIGNVNLTGLSYAKGATVTGTVDLTSSALYGASGTLAGSTLIAEIDSGGSTTATFGSGTSAPGNSSDVLSTLNTAFGGSFFTLSLQNKLKITGAVLGLTNGEIDITGGTGRAALGLTVATTAGTNGTLDGGTLILDEDTTSPSTITFGNPADAAAVVTAVAAATNIDASLYGASNYLRVQSSTVGSASRLSITGGSKRATLGLALSTTAAQGAESTITIAHLGLTYTFTADASTFVPGTLYANTCAAGKPSAAEVNTQIDAFIARRFPFAEFVIASELDLVSSAGLFSSLDTKVGLLESSNKVYPRALFGLMNGEDRDQIKATFTARSRRVDVAATAGYFTTGGNIPGGGAVPRSLSWGAAAVDASIPFSKDRGDHSYPPIPFCVAIVDDESRATSKLVTAPGGSGMSFNVADVGSTGEIRFAGGYSGAAATSLYMDQSTRNVVLRGATLAQPVLDGFINTTGFDTDAKGFLTAQSATVLENAVDQALRGELVPAHCTGLSVAADMTVSYFTTRQAKVKVTYYVRFPARSIVATMGPGLIEE